MSATLGRTFVLPTAVPVLWRARRRRVSVGWLVVLVVLASIQLSPAKAAYADPAGSSADPVGTTALPTAQINGVVWKQVVVGDRVFAGGRFSKARPAGAAVGTHEVARSNLLAYGLSSGMLDTRFAPALNAQVSNLAVSPNGKTLFVVGTFTKVGTSIRNRIAAFDIATGKLLPFAPNLNGPASAVLMVGTTVYVGGSFSAANGKARAKAAAFTTGGVLRHWSPAVSNGHVAQIVASPDKTRLVLGGNFTSVDGSSDGYGLARVGLDTGTVLYPMAIDKLVRNGLTASGGIYGLAADSTGFYGTGWGNSPTLEGTFKADWKGNLVWLEDCHGDSYSIYPTPGVVYVASHAHYCGNVGSFGERSKGIGHRALAWTNSVGGKISMDPTHYKSWGGVARPSQLSFYPDINTGTYTGQSQGPWTVTGSGGYVLYGGEFTEVNGHAQQGLVRFVARSLRRSTDGPLRPADWKPGVKTYADGIVRIIWTALADRDNSTVKYQVIKNGDTAHPIYYGISRASFWSLPVVGAFDHGLSPGDSTTYQVRAVDGDGNAAVSDVVTCTYGGGPSVGAYDTTVLDGNPRYYWRNGDTHVAGSGSAAGAAPVDLVGTGKPIVDSSVGSDPEGPLGSGSTAFTFDGSDKLVTSQAELAPNVFSLATWFKTTSTTGGSLINMGNAQSGDSSTYNSSSKDPSNPDRTIYLSPSGTVNFGVWARGAHTVSTTKTYNDGTWHQAVATMDTGGMRLYVDGSLVGTLATTYAGINVTGYWRVGGDKLTGWPGNPSTGYYTGSLDQVAIYPSVLSAAEVSSQYAAR